MSDELHSSRAFARSSADGDAGRRPRDAAARRGRRPRTIAASALSVRKEVMVRRAVNRLVEVR